MHFLNPIALVGLVAALVPLAIHLLHRGRSRSRPFSNLDFLRAVHQRRMRSIQLRQWLVLLLRTLAVGLIAAALARPTYRADWGQGLFGRRVPATTAILLDRSLSTDYRLPSGRVFSQLRDQALDLLGLFADTDDVTVVAFGEHTDIIRGDGIDRVREAVLELPASEESTDAGGAIAAAARILATGPVANRELFVLSDFVRRDWVGATAAIDAAASLSGVRIYASPPAPPPRGNVYVDTVALASWLPTAGQTMAFDVRLTNASDRDVEDVPVDLYLDGERLQRRLVESLPAHGTVHTDFTVALRRAGNTVGFVELEQDALPLDDRYYFSFHVPERIDVLLLGQRPADTYYPRRALAAAAGADPVVAVEARILEELESLSLADYDVVVLCNLERLSPEQTLAIHRHVGAGSALVVFPSPRADLNYYNRRLLPPLLPLALGGAGSPPPAGAGGPSFHLDPARPFHPLLRGLWTAQPQDRPRFRRSFDLVPSIPTRALAHFSDGRPALVEGSNGGGRILLFAAPLDLRWSDLPLKGMFLPLLQRLVRHLSQPASHGSVHLVGETVRRELDRAVDAERILAESPSGRRQFLDAQLTDGRLRWRLRRVDESGIWTLSDAGRVVDRFAVNVDRRESQLAPLPRERFAEVFGPQRLRLVEAGTDYGAAVLAHRTGRELWREFLMAAFALLLLELWLARAPSAATSAPARS